MHVLIAFWTAIVNFFWRGCCRAGILRQTGLANPVDTPKSVLAGMWCGWAAVCCGYGPCRLLCCRSSPSEQSGDHGDVENQSNGEHLIPPAQQQDLPASGNVVYNQPIAPAHPAIPPGQLLMPPGQQHDFQASAATNSLPPPYASVSKADDVAAASAPPPRSSAGGGMVQPGLVRLPAVQGEDGNWYVWLDPSSTNPR